MTKGDRAYSLSATRHFVLVLRVVVEVGGKVSGEIVNPMSEQRRCFTGFASLFDTLGMCIDDALGGTVRDNESSAD